MPEGNQSSVTEFVLAGFSGLHPEYQGLASAVLFFVYLFTMIGNTVIICLFATDRGLHKPMYRIMLNLVATDILFSTATLPKIITKYWFHSATISFNGCFIQMYFVHFLGTVNSFVLFLMALDRYLAICNPLKYPVIMRNSTVCALSVTVWIVGNVGSLMIVIRAYPLPYCASNIIAHCFCDHISITRLACTDRAPYGIPAFITAMIALLVPLGFIIFSYVSIVIAVVRMPNSQSRLKTMSTCCTQLIVISLYYLPRCFVYLASNVGIRFSSDMRIVTIMLYSLLPPMINPLVYFLRAKDMRESLIRRIKRIRISQNAQVTVISKNW